MYGHSPIGDLIIYMDNYLIREIYIFIETIGLKVTYIYKNMHCIVRGRPQQCAGTPLVTPQEGMI
jgi:hypothetical protein